MRFDLGFSTFTEYADCTLEFAGAVIPLASRTSGEDRGSYFTRAWVTANAPSLSLANYQTTLPVGAEIAVCLRLTTDSHWPSDGAIAITRNVPYICGQPMGTVPKSYSAGRKVKMVHPILFVGSLGMSDAETAFRTVAEKVGDLAKRYPDGEPGARSIWIRYQIDMLEAHPKIELVKRVEMQAGGEMFNRPYYRPVEGEDIPGFDFGALGYAAEAEKSYAIFKKLRSEGVIPAGTRFQVCLPTPVAVVQGFIDPEIQATIEPAYDKAMRAELANIVSAIPNDDLSIQWDIASEVITVEGGRELFYDDPFDGSVERVSELSDLLPEPAELGIHLCYGDPGHKHVIEPPDLSVCVQFANALTAGISRSVQWMHMPVPRDRDDDAYFAPLANLDMTPETELILGLVHHTGGIDATLGRLVTARRHAAEFGIATECGFGRRKPETLPELFEIHVAAASS